MGKARCGSSRHEMWFASTGRRGGETDFCTAGSPITMTDFGLLKEGGVLRRRSRLWLAASRGGKAMAGMY